MPSKNRQNGAFLKADLQSGCKVHLRCVVCFLTTLGLLLLFFAALKWWMTRSTGGLLWIHCGVR